MPQHGPRAVVFGGSGFIGSHLASHLSVEGYDVTVADVVLPKRPMSENIRFAFVDVRRAITLSVPEPDAVFNLAAVHRTPGHAENEYYDTNVAGAINVTRWCNKMGANQLVFTSSISVYGPAEEPRSEASDLLPNSSYGRSKLLAETIHREWASRDDRRLVVVRPAVVFGPGEGGNFTRLARALSKRRFVYPGRDDTVKACGYVADLIRSVVFALSRPEQEYTFNYCYPKSYTIREICETFSQVAGYARAHKIPPAAAESMLKLLTAAARTNYSGRFSAERVRKLTASTNVIPQTLKESGFQWATTLASGLEDWFLSDPQGVFV
jgi:nucleoside-diphosphate-sugar epimerase